MHPQYNALAECILTVDGPGLQQHHHQYLRFFLISRSGFFKDSSPFMSAFVSVRYTRCSEGGSHAITG